MKIILAFDSFKGSYSSIEICELAYTHLKELVPGADILRRPLADGGEGTLEVLKTTGKAEVCRARVTGPLEEMQVDAEYLYFGNTKTVFIELAQAAGLPLLDKQQRNPFKTTTYGVGELILDSLKLNPQKICLAIGGSATNDMGTGMAMALGWQFLKSNGEKITLGVKELDLIAGILPAQIELPPVHVLCDVNNPLCGPNGASFIYGPQKGAGPEICQELDLKLKHVAEIAQTKLGCATADIPGAGAAGGMGAGAIAFLKATLKPGIQEIIALTKLAEEAKDADWLITGEGRFDEQSLSGKVVSGLLELLQTGGRLAVIAGSSTLSSETAKSSGVDFLFSLNAGTEPIEVAITKTPEHIKIAMQELKKVL